MINLRETADSAIRSTLWSESPAGAEKVEFVMELTPARKLKLE